MSKKQTETEATTRDTNPDPITGAPGSHPVGTGVGAAAGGATGAAIGAAAGPIGSAVGAVIGAVAGGYAGKGLAEVIDPTAEDAYWREQHGRQTYARKGLAYDDYAPAYRAGYTGYREGQTFADREADLRKEYESAAEKSAAGYAKGEEGTTTPDSTPGMAAHQARTSRLGWDEAREAAHAAYDRVGRGEARRIRASVAGTNEGLG